MRGLIVFLARRPVTVIMAMAAVCIAAVFAFTVLPLDRLPEMSVPRVTVETVYPGMAADDIRSLVTIPVEDAFSPVKALERMRSVSRDNSSLVVLDFRWGTDPMAASALVREAIDAVYPALPLGVRKPAIRTADAAGEPHVIVAVRSLSGDQNFAFALADRDLRARLRRIDGVGSVLIAGGAADEGHLRLDIPRLAAMGLSPPEFAGLLSRETTDIPAGNAREGIMELVVVSSGRPGGIEDLANITLPSLVTPGDNRTGVHGTPGVHKTSDIYRTSLRISDAGEINLEAGRKNSVFVFDGREVVALEIYRRPGADPIRLSGDIQKVLKDAGEKFSHNVEISLIKDAAPDLVRSMTSLAASALMGAAAVIAVLLVFIRRLRTCFLAALSIPVSVSAGICVLAIAGRTLNSMSLGGLALGIGMVSDVAVIMLDLLNRSFGGFQEKPSPQQTGERAASIAVSSAASTITTAVVFVPVIFLPGQLGSLFGDTAIALVASIFAGWLYAQFCIPSLYRFTFGNIAIRKINFVSAGSASLERKYRKTLAPVLRRPRKWYAIAGMASLAGFLLLVIRPVAFVSPDAAQEVLVSVAFPAGTILENAGAYGAALSESLLALPCVKSVYGRAGAEDEDVNRRADMDYRREELVIHCIPAKGITAQKALGSIQLAVTEENHSVFLPTDRTETLLGLSPVSSYAVRGKDREETLERVTTAKKRLDDNSPGKTVRLRPQGIRPELRVYPNREAAAYFGISAADMAESLYIMNEGVIATSLEVEGRPLDIRISGNHDTWNVSQNISLENFPIKTAQGKTVFLGSLGRVERREADAVLARLDRSDVFYLDLPQDKPLAKAAQKLGASVSWFFRTDESVFSRYRNSLFLNLILALTLIYMTMGAQFESFLLPLFLMLTIPFSLAGAGPALVLFNSRLDSGAVLGLCALFGLVVNNGLILFEISEERIHLGFNPAGAVYGGASIRLRPVLVTALTTICALLPVALNPMGSAQKSMAAAMLGGLGASTILSLFILPPVFVRFFAWREKR